MQCYLPPFDIRKNWNAAPHVVILGAGASLASFPRGDKNGIPLPLMNNFINTLGISELVEQNHQKIGSNNFEEVFSEIHSNAESSIIKEQFENEIRKYFTGMNIGEEVTIYDKLIFALRKKDLIATFNWDPLLMQAYNRARKLLKNNLPGIVFLHGNVAIGYCPEHFCYGNISARCLKCGIPFKQTPLLLPIKNKKYTDEPFIKFQWSIFRSHLRFAYLTTIFGYSAPKSDAVAKGIFTKAFRKNDYRGQYEIEIVDILDEDLLFEKWENIIFKDYCNFHTTIDNSLIFEYPRRSCEAFASAYLQCDPWEFRKMPKIKRYDSLYNHFLPYVNEEINYEKEGTALTKW